MKILALDPAAVVNNRVRRKMKRAGREFHLLPGSIHNTCCKEQGIMANSKPIQKIAREQLNKLPEAAKLIPGHDGYAASADGSIWSCLKRIRLPSGRRGSAIVVGDSWKRLKPSIGTNGYLGVHLRRKPFAVHRLVLLAFSGECPSGCEACHCNGIKLDNRAENLRWAPHRENNHDKKTHGTNRGPRGEECGRSKLTPEDVYEIRRLAGSGHPHDQIAVSFNIQKAAVSKIHLRQRWSHLPEQKEST